MHRSTLTFTYRGATATLTPLPGCAHVYVVHAASVPRELRGQGIATAAHADLLASLQPGEYSLLLATVQDDNAACRALLAKAQWAKLASFRNPETRKLVSLYAKAAPEERPRR